MYKSGSHPKKGMWQTWLLSIAIWFEVNISGPASRFVWKLPLRQESCHLLCRRSQAAADGSDRTLIRTCWWWRQRLAINSHHWSYHNVIKTDGRKPTTCLPQASNPTVSGSLDDNLSFLIAFLPEILEARELEVMRFVSSLTDIVDNGAVLKVPMKSETVNCWPTQGYFQHYYIHYSSTWEGGYLPVNHRFDNQ